MSAISIDLLLSVVNVLFNAIPAILGIWAFIQAQRRQRRQQRWQPEEPEDWRELHVHIEAPVEYPLFYATAEHDDASK
ncbi:hypothetical protein MMC10_011248 [Thelotrema lepadinum]|nr:hypothetical protein [Thelotrema lepadinum]